METNTEFVKNIRKRISILKASSAHKGDVSVLPLSFEEAEDACDHIEQADKDIAELDAEAEKLTIEKNQTESKIEQQQKMIRELVKANKLVLKVIDNELYDAIAKAEEFLK